MKWIRERDLLIAQTLAFVQSVTGKKPEAGAQPPPESAPVEKFEPTGLPVEAVETPRKLPVAPSALREEIENRVATFRAHQQRFDREREKHFDTVLTRIRAAIASPSSGPPPQT